MNELSEAQEVIESLQVANARLQHENMCNVLVNNFTELMYGASTVNEVLDILYYSLPEVVSFKKIIYFSVQKDAFSLELTKAIGFEDSEQPSKISISFEDCDDDIAQAVFSNSQITVEDGIDDNDSLSIALQAPSYMLVPLVCKGLARTKIDNLQNVSYKNEETRRRALLRDPDFPTMGLFWFDTDDADEQTIAQDISILSQFIHVAGVIMDNIRMMGSLKSVNERINRELEQARKVQEGLLPPSLPNSDELRVYAHYTPEETVGGDYYDVFPLEEGIYGILVADVSGHGPSSALVMAMMKVLLRSYAGVDVMPADTFEVINKMMMEYVPTNKFVTSFYGILDLKKHVLNYASAGHCSQLFIDKEADEPEFQDMKSGGFFIGMFPKLDLANESIEFKPGKNRIILFTDGLTEAMDKNSEQYSLERLKYSAEMYLGFTPRDAVKGMIKDMTKFIGDCPLDDDVTLLVLDF